jgi:hypothetical protein
MESEPQKKRSRTTDKKQTITPSAAVNAVLDKYTTTGWSAHQPSGGVNHIIAYRGKRLHFIQVVTPETVDSPEYQGGGIPCNTFVQNALSNSAEPIHALVSTKHGHTTVSLTNVNDNSRVVIASRPTKPPAAAGVSTVDK